MVQSMKKLTGWLAALAATLIAVPPVTYGQATLVETIDLRTWTGVPVQIVQPPPPVPAPGFALSSIAFDPVINTLYVADYATTNVYLIDATTNTITSAVYTNGIAPITSDIGPMQNLPGTAPNVVLANPTTNQWVFMGQGGGAQFSGTTFVEAVSARAFPFGGAWDPATDDVYGTDGIEFFGVSNLKFLYGGYPCAGASNTVAINPMTSRVYVSCGTGVSGGLVIFDGLALSQANAKITTPPLANQLSGAQPSGLAVNPNTNRLYVVGFTSPTSLDVLDASTYQVLTSIPGLAPSSPAYLPPGMPLPRPVAINTATNTIFVVNTNLSSISVFDGKSNTLTGTITTPDGAVAVVVNEATNTLYVANYIGTISVFALNPPAVPPAYSVNGVIRNAQGTPVAGVTVNATSAAGRATAVTDVTGLFVLTGMPTGTYTVAPASPLYAFSPASQSVSVNGRNLGGLAFQANPPIVPTHYALSPWTMIGPGVTTTGTVTLNQPAPASGAVITLLASNPKPAKFPATVTVPAGQSAVSFPVQGNGVSATTTITLTAQYNGGTASTRLTVAPGDKVTITAATYSKSTHNLVVSATGSNPQATLNVYLASNNQLLGTMVNQGGGNYTLQLVYAAGTPASVNVVSNLGAKTGQGVTLIP